MNEMRQNLRHYLEVPRPLVAAAKEFTAGVSTGRHKHRRAQLIFAISGLMIAKADHGTWVVPSGYALWVPAGINHEVTMRGAVSMRTIYVQSGATAGLPSACRVIAVSPLLEATLVALSAEPALYDEHRRGGHLAALALDEIARAPETPFALAVPADARLRKLARALIANPGSSLNLDGWCDRIGVSRRTMTRLFRRQTGLSFGSWRRRLRILEAAARQADGEALAKIAGTLGYNNFAAFRAMARRDCRSLFNK